MTATRVTILLCGAAAAAFWAAELAQGQSKVMEVKQTQLDGLPAKLWKRVAEHQKALESLDDSDAAKGVYSTVWLWPPSYPKLRVCFFGGPLIARQLIAQTAKEWESDQMAIKLDFGDMNDPRQCGQGDGRENQIRISFDQLGYWSQLGQFSITYVKQEEASMNFEGLDKIEPGQIYNDYAFGTIRHEFGHALGLYHEHQSPEAHCDKEFNWNFIYDYLKGPPNNWPKEQIDFNLQPLPDDTQGVMVTDFDNTSVMLYQFPDKYYLNGTASRCYIPAPNSQISRVDREVVNYMYPANPQARIERFQKNKDAFAAIWNKASDEGKKGVMVDMMKVFFEPPGTAGQ